MILELLSPIIKTANKKQIKKHLKAFGYIDCKKDRNLKNLSIETLFKGELKETKTFPDNKGKRTYQGGIFTNVKSFERLEFIIININNNENILPIDMLIWAKEVKK